MNDYVFLHGGDVEDNTDFQGEKWGSVDYRKIHGDDLDENGNSRRSKSNVSLYFNEISGRYLGEKCDFLDQNYVRSDTLNKICFVKIIDVSVQHSIFPTAENDCVLDVFTLRALSSEEIRNKMNDGDPK